MLVAPRKALWKNQMIPSVNTLLTGVSEPHSRRNEEVRSDDLCEEERSRKFGIPESGCKPLSSAPSARSRGKLMEKKRDLPQNEAQFLLLRSPGLGFDACFKDESILILSWI